MWLFPVWSSVRTSNASSIVPKPPAKRATPLASLRKSSFRVKKYFTDTSRGLPARIELSACSNGRRMLIPMERSGPAPRFAASMIPPPAPVTMNQPRAAISRPNASAWR